MSRPNPTDRVYSKDHEWVKADENGIAVIGITDYAQEMLTDIVFVELPQVGRKISKGEVMAVVESVKSVSDVYAPVSGEVIEVNSELENTPDLINSDAFEEGWIAKVKLDDATELQLLMTADAYAAIIAEEKH
jgi:glycine cleavage system H protein